jgi:hypothetical protein
MMVYLLCGTGGCVPGGRLGGEERPIPNIAQLLMSLSPRPPNKAILISLLLASGILIQSGQRYVRELQTGGKPSINKIFI